MQYDLLDNRFRNRFKEQKDIYRNLSLNLKPNLSDPEVYYKFMLELLNINNEFGKKGLAVTDLKGENLMVAFNGQIKVIDYGGISSYGTPTY